MKHNNHKYKILFLIKSIFNNYASGMVKTCVLLLLLIISINNIQSQEQKRIDSLKSLIIQREAKGIADTTLLSLYFDISTELSKSQPSEAFNYLNKSVNIAQKLGLPNFLSSAYYHIGYLYETQNHYYLAMESFQKSYQILLDRGMIEAISFILIEIGNVYYAQQIYDLATEYFNKALETFTEKDYKHGIALSYNNLGLVKRQLKQYDSALYYFGKGLEIRNNLGDPFLLAHSYRYIGATYLLMGDLEKAYQYLNISLKQMNDYPHRPSEEYLIPEIQESFGDLFKKEKKYDKAIDSYNQAINSVTINTNDKFAICSLYFKIGELFELNKNSTEAIVYLWKSINLAESINNLERQKDGYLMLSDIYSTSNPDLGLKFHKIYSSLIDSLYDKRQQRMLSEIRVTIETHEKEKKLEMETNKLARINAESKIQTIIYSGSVLILLTVVVMFFIFYRRKVSANRLLEGKNQEITAKNDEIETQKDLLIHENFERKKVEELLNKNAEELKELNATKDKFFSIIAHDIKNPLSAMLNITELMSDPNYKLDNEEIVEFSNAINKATKNLYRLLENLLAWSRSQRGKIPFVPENNNLFELVQACIMLNYSNARAKQIKMTDSISNDITIFSDYNMTTFIIRNLISNSVKFTMQGGTIAIGAKISGEEEVIIFIRDSGIGMEKELIENLFKIDVNTTMFGTNNEKGTGLGLILCKEFVEKQGGRIWVESKPGEGSIFSFSLPLGRN